MSHLIWVYICTPCRGGFIQMLKATQSLIKSKRATAENLRRAVVARLLAQINAKALSFQTETPRVCSHPLWISLAQSVM